MKIAYIHSKHCNGLYFSKRMEGFKLFGSIDDIKENFDVILVESIGEEAIKASKLNKQVYIRATGTDLYQGNLDRIQWQNVNLLVLSENHKEYFKTRYNYQPQSINVLNFPCDETFTLKKGEPNQHVAIIAHITGRKGTDQIPELLRKTNVHVHHIGSPMLYGHPVKAFIDYKIKQDGNEDRYHWKKRVDHSQINKWLENKTYIWLPSINEGQSRVIMEGMMKGLKPLVRNYPGSQEHFEGYTYDSMGELIEMINGDINPIEYQKSVRARFSMNQIATKFKEIVK